MWQDEYGANASLVEYSMLYSTRDTRKWDREKWASDLFKGGRTFEGRLLAEMKKMQAQRVEGRGWVHCRYFRRTNCVCLCKRHAVCLVPCAIGWKRIPSRPLVCVRACPRAERARPPAGAR